MIRQTMCLNGVLNGMVSATMQNRQSTIQRDQCQGLCVSHAVVLGIILRIACEFLAVLKSIQPACLTMLNFVVSKLYLSLLSFPLFTYLLELKANSDPSPCAFNRIVCILTRKLLIIREYCMLTYDRIPQGSLSFIHQTDHL